ncbi:MULTISPECIES: hypothetical protein [Epilithonimonas]|uniref:Uncharacterized protein n=1 Tax=Epilithonimonas hominis TaxID=420404 RepID=A0A1H6LPD3_9FLAO|nr:MULTISPECIES: hypothetical protein [Epilithonimonas]SEH88028.1 hypothetical protein SAMN05421793_14422 [Epilithonimonas hominis]
MNAKELRIGNMISDIDGNITEVNIDIMQNIIQGGDQYQPVELCDKCFNKLGFIQEHLGHYFDDIYDFSVLASRNNSYIVRWGNQVLAGAEPIRYIHELQNIFFALKGRDLDVRRFYSDVVNQTKPAFA